MDTLDLVEYLSDREKWPWFADGERLDKLEELAQAAYKRDTPDGYLAYILIMHQICEELIKQLISKERFYIQVCMADGFSVQFSKDGKNADLDNKMFGKLLETLQYPIQYDEKESFTRLCNELNTIRISVVHKLAKNVDLANLQNLSNKYKDKYSEVEEAWKEIDDLFNLSLKDHRKDDSWDEILQEYIDDIDNLPLEVVAQIERIKILRGWEKNNS